MMLQYLIEFRRRALYILCWFLLLFIISYFFSAKLFDYILTPLLGALPKGNTLVATEITSTFFIPIQLAANAALIGTIPFLLVQLWCFIAPGLYKKERRFFAGVGLLSIILFLLGVLFCFYGVLPLMFTMLIEAVPAKVQLMPDMRYSIDFVLHMLLVFGFCFQVPLVCFVFVQTKCIEVQALQALRPYIIVAAFVIGMLLTPPDVLSQLLLAIPLCLLYELGILLSKRSMRMSV